MPVSPTIISMLHHAALQIHTSLLFSSDYADTLEIMSGKDSAARHDAGSARFLGVKHLGTLEFKTFKRFGASHGTGFSGSAAPTAASATGSSEGSGGAKPSVTPFPDAGKHGAAVTGPGRVFIPGLDVGPPFVLPPAADPAAAAAAATAAAAAAQKAKHHHHHHHRSSTAAKTPAGATKTPTTAKAGASAATAGKSRKTIKELLAEHAKLEEKPVAKTGTGSGAPVAAGGKSAAAGGAAGKGGKPGSRFGPKFAANSRSVVKEVKLSKAEALAALRGRKSTTAAPGVPPPVAPAPPAPTAVAVAS